jgi:hypothetical protein
MGELVLYKYADNSQLTEEDAEHINELIYEGYREGELDKYNEKKKESVRGYWTYPNLDMLKEKRFSPIEKRHLEYRGFVYDKIQKCYKWKKENGISTFTLHKYESNIYKLEGGKFKCIDNNLSTCIAICNGSC